MLRNSNNDGEFGPKLGLAFLGGRCELRARNTATWVTSAPKPLVTSTLSWSHNPLEIQLAFSCIRLAAAQANGKIVPGIHRCVYDGGDFLSSPTNSRSTLTEIHLAVRFFNALGLSYMPGQGDWLPQGIEAARGLL
jgi:hypothetical protein